MIPLRLNKAPIFLNAFARGGSSIVWNLLQSHPDVVSPLVETHQLFIGKADDGSNRRKFLVHLRHALKGGGLPRPRIVGRNVFPNAGLFDPSNYAPRGIPKALQTELDRMLTEAKMRNLDDPLFRFRTIEEAYSAESIEAARLVAKNINGIVWLSDALASMYPDATFIGLVRDGFPLCESRIRRGTIQSAEKFGVAYRLLVEELLAQNQRIGRYRIFRFEDLLRDPHAFLSDLYSHAQLEGSVSHVRLKNKAHFTSGGQYKRVANSGSHLWLPLDQLDSYLNARIDADQARRLSADDRASFIRGARGAMEQLGYV